MLRAPLSAVFPAFLTAYSLPGFGAVVQPGTLDVPQDSAPRLRIVIVEAEGAINKIRRRLNREPIVQVEDENRRPVAGAVVVSLLPSQGPGGVFLDGGRSFTTITDKLGRSVMRGFRPNSMQGKFEIRVTASRNGQTVSTNIHQSSVSSPASGSGSGLSSGAKWAIVLGVVMAGAAGGTLAVTRGGGSTAPPPLPATLLTPGTPTVGGPR